MSSFTIRLVLLICVVACSGGNDGSTPSDCTEVPDNPQCPNGQLLRPSDFVEYELGRDFREFGRTLSASGDWLAVAARLDDDIEQDAGAVYMFRLVDGRWEEQQKLAPADLIVRAKFGDAMAMDEGRLVVTAPLMDNFYVFELVNEEWSEAAKIQLDSRVSLSEGDSIALHGDRVILGASKSSPDDVIQAGSAAIYEFDGTKWDLATLLSLQNPARNDQFGSGVAIHGEVAMVAASALEAGPTLFFFESSEQGWQTLESIPGRGSLAGHDMELSDSTLIATHFGSSDEITPGGVSFLERMGTSWTTKQTEDDLLSDEFTVETQVVWRVARSESLVALALTGRWDPSEGKATALRLEDGAWRPVRVMSASTSALADRFGADVAVARDHVLVSSDALQGTVRPEERQFADGVVYAFQIE